MCAMNRRFGAHSTLESFGADGGLLAEGAADEPEELELELKRGRAASRSRVARLAGV